MPPTLTYQWVYFQAGPHRRQPPPRASNGGFVELPTRAQWGPTGVITGQQVQWGGVLQKDWIVDNPDGSQLTYQFAFVNVTGGDPSPASSTDPNNPPAIQIGEDPVVVLVVYVPVEGPGIAPANDSGATIDAFDESTNLLVDDDFVIAYAPPGQTTTKDAEQTTSGNVSGWVDTWSTGETIAAYPRISEYTNNPSPDFDKWVNLLPSSEGVTIGGTDNADLTVSIKTSAYALAFYKNNARPLVIEHVPPHLTQALYGPDGQLLAPGDKPGAPLQEQRPQGAGPEGV